MLLLVLRENNNVASWIIEIIVYLKLLNFMYCIFSLYILRTNIVIRLTYYC